MAASVVATTSSAPTLVESHAMKVPQVQAIIFKLFPRMTVIFSWRMRVVLCSNVIYRAQTVGPWRRIVPCLEIVVCWTTFYTVLNRLKYLHWPFMEIKWTLRIE